MASRFIWVGGLVAALVIALGGFLTERRQPQSPGLSGRRPVLLWQDQPAQASAHTAAGIFGIKSAVAIGNSLLLFYAMQPSALEHPGITAVSAISEMAGGQGGGNLPVDQVQTLGTLDGVDIGLIHLLVADRVGQRIELQVAPGQDKGQAWVVTPQSRSNTANQVERRTRRFYNCFCPRNRALLQCSYALTASRR